MRRSLPDTDILSEFFKGNKKVVYLADEYLQQYSFITFSIITYYEILNGLLYKDAKSQLKKFHDFVEHNRVLPLSLRDTVIAAEIYADLRKKGKPIGHTDSLIAGIALSNNMQLVTNNTAHFERVPELKLINWMK